MRKNNLTDINFFKKINHAILGVLFILIGVAILFRNPLKLRFGNLIESFEGTYLIEAYALLCILIGVFRFYYIVLHKRNEDEYEDEI